MNNDYEHRYFWKELSLTLPPEFPYPIGVAGKEYSSHATAVLDMKITLTDKQNQYANQENKH